MSKEKKAIKVTHRSRPAEPWGKEHEQGRVLAAKPASGPINAQAFVDWGEYFTWEKCSDLVLPGGAWDAVRKTLREQ